MQVEISERAQAAVDRLVANGDFASADEAIETALESLAEAREQYWQQVNELVEEGRQSLREQPGFVLTPENKAEFLAAVERRGRERLEARQHAHG